MEEAAKLICSSGGYNGDLAAEGEEKCAVIAAISSATAEINNGDSSGEGEAVYHHRDDGDDSDYLPRKLRKYRSIAAIYQSTKPSEIAINTTAKRRQGKNNGKKVEKRTMKKAAADDEEAGNKAAAAVSTGGDSNFIEVESLEEAVEMEEACPTRNPKFRSISELYEITQLLPATSCDS
nr:uncharacterized protein LOC109165761 [Ipomoea batatas]GME13730.1 uncharacterized protein LOC109165761 [Ipomoea batatas]